MFKLSDAANLAFHAMMVLASDPDANQQSVTQLADYLGVSDNHLAKVMQRLSKVGLVVSRRGPKGGFSLGRPAKEITLKEIYEVMEGPLIERACMLDRPVCDGTRCLLGNLVSTIHHQISSHLTNTSLADVTITKRKR